MARKKKTIKVTYIFDVEYEHEDHLEDIKRGLKKAPHYDMRGAGAAGNNKVYGYACKMRKNCGELDC